MTELDPKFTFETFVVGPANRLASAAARRAADSPGTSYNPLFLYANSGLGKSHILVAIAHHASRNNPQVRTLYQTLEGYLNELTEALEAGARDRMRDRYRDVDILLLDDVQFLAGQAEAQEMLLSSIDSLTASGSQVVLASDRPPSEINGLDARLVSRFSGGLLVDIAPPEFETRVAIIQRKVRERGSELPQDVAEALARLGFRNVRELGGALNRVLAVQDLEGRTLSGADIPGIVGVEADAPAPTQDPFGSFLNEVSGAVEQEVLEHEEPWRVEIRGAADVAEREGFVVKRLRALLQQDNEPDGWKPRLEKFRTAVGRLREIDRELDRLKNPWPDAAAALVKDPDRLEEAEAFLASVSERQRPFPAISDGPDLESVSGNFKPLAVKAAMQLVGREKPEYNPLFLWNGDAHTARALLLAAGRTYRKANPEARMAVTSVSDFSSDFIRALSAGVAGAWRERWWTVDLLLVYGAQDLSGTERAQDEFFHLFEALKRRGARVLLTADCPPSRIGNIDERLRSRFEGGLVVEVEGRGITEEAGAVTFAEPAAGADASAGVSPWEGLAETVAPEPGAATDDIAQGPVVPPIEEIQLDDDRAGLIPDPPVAPATPEPTPAPSAATPSAGTGASAAPKPAATPAVEDGPWRPSREKVVWVWPAFEERLVEDLS